MQPCRPRSRSLARSSLHAMYVDLYICIYLPVVRSTCTGSAKKKAVYMCLDLSILSLVLALVPVGKGAFRSKHAVLLDTCVCRTRSSWWLVHVASRGTTRAVVVPAEGGKRRAAKTATGGRRHSRQSSQDGPPWCRAHSPPKPFPRGAPLASTGTAHAAAMVEWRCMERAAAVMMR